MIGIVLALIGGGFAVGDAVRRHYRNIKMREYKPDMNAYHYPDGNYYDVNTGCRLQLSWQNHDLIAHNPVTKQDLNVSEVRREIAFERLRNNPTFKGTTLKWGDCVFEGNDVAPCKGPLYRDLKTGDYYVAIHLNARVGINDHSFINNSFYMDIKTGNVVRPTDWTRGLIESKKDQWEKYEVETREDIYKRDELARKFSPQCADRWFNSVKEGRLKLKEEYSREKIEERVAETMRCFNELDVEEKRKKCSYVLKDLVENYVKPEYWK